MQLGPDCGLRGPYAPESPALNVVAHESDTPPEPISDSEAMSTSGFRKTGGFTRLAARWARMQKKARMQKHFCTRARIGLCLWPQSKAQDVLDEPHELRPLLRDMC